VASTGSTDLETSTAPADVVRRQYLASATGDLEAFRATVAPDVEWTQTASFPLSGTHPTPDGVIAGVMADRRQDKAQANPLSATDERKGRTLHPPPARRMAYARPYRTEQERRDPYHLWLHHYDHHRARTSLKGQPPASRVPNLAGQYS
jgi:ketosteroid isomerase-like protein